VVYQADLVGALLLVELRDQELLVRVLQVEVPQVLTLISLVAAAVARVL
jgi:hypothetical protein